MTVTNRWGNGFERQYELHRSPVVVSFQHLLYSEAKAHIERFLQACHDNDILPTGFEVEQVSRAWA